MVEVVGEGFLVLQYEDGYWCSVGIYDLEIDKNYEFFIVVIGEFVMFLGLMYLVFNV